jgi:hypothetical protein
VPFSNGIPAILEPTDLTPSGHRPQAEADFEPIQVGDRGSISREETPRLIASVVGVAERERKAVVYHDKKRPGLRRGNGPEVRAYSFSIVLACCNLIVADILDSRLGMRRSLHQSVVLLRRMRRGVMKGPTYLLDERCLPLLFEGTACNSGS